MDSAGYAVKFKKMEVPFQDLNLLTQKIKSDFLHSVDAWLNHNDFILGEKVLKFEKEWANYCGANYCTGVSSGSDALYIALLSLDIGEGDEVITQGNAYNATVVAILRTGATPRFADYGGGFDEFVLNVKKKINKHTKAILPVYLYGYVPSLANLKLYGLPVIEDCAQAHGAKLQGDIACFSFYPTKSLGAFGDAGAVVYNDYRLHEKIKAIRNLGQTEKNQHLFYGSTMRLDPIQAIVLSLKLKNLDNELTEKRVIVEYYDKNLRIFTKKEVSYYPHIYPIFHKKRDLIRQELAEAGIKTEIHYPTPVYRQPFYRVPFNDSCPKSEILCRTELSLPLFIGLTKKQQDYVIGRIKKIIND